MIAINDALFLESAIYTILKKYFSDKPYYVSIMELFHEVCLIYYYRLIKLYDILFYCKYFLSLSLSLSLYVCVLVSGSANFFIILLDLLFIQSLD